MIPVDLHTHSSFSLCGVHSVIEMLSHAESLGMKGIAITDHGPTTGGRISATFFDRLFDPVPGIRLLKGMECNLGEKPGEIDLPMRLLRYMDIVLVGIHPNTPRGLGSGNYTDLLVAAMEKNPYIDIIAHPNSAEFPLDQFRLAREAKRLDVAVELNNSKPMLRRVDDGVTEELVVACREAGCAVAVNSDAHALNEIGCDEALRPFIERAGLPESQIVNHSAESAFRFIARRREVKSRYC